MAESFVHPGAIGIHEHFREPSPAHKAETFSSGTRAAVLGGFVMTSDMPNTPKYETWTEERLEEKHGIINETAYHFATAHTGSQPESDNVGQLQAMSAISLLYKIYAAATQGTHRDYEASEFSENIGEWHKHAPNKPIGLHAGKENLEDFIGYIARDLGHPMIVHHVNHPSQVRLVQAAKADDLPVFSAVCMHHILKCSHDELGEGWFARMQPPLAEQSDAEELLRLLADGLIDVVETDHAPHAKAMKWKAEDENPQAIHDPEHTTCFGVPGIEWALPLLFYLEKRGFITMERIIDASSTKPLELLGLRRNPKTHVVWDMEEYRIDETDIQTGARWSPFAGKLAVGRVKEMVIAGQNVVDNYKHFNRKPKAVTERGTVI